MKLTWSLIATGLISILGVASAEAQTVKVGTFHKASLVVAFYRSEAWGRTLRQKREESEQAKKANDTKKVAQLESWGSEQQEIAHKQLAGEAPITNIIEALSPGFAEVARRAQVPMIVADLPYADHTVQTVDVTGLLLDWLKSDERTRGIVRQLRNHQGPLPPRP